MNGEGVSGWVEVGGRGVGERGRGKGKKIILL